MSVCVVSHPHAIAGRLMVGALVGSLGYAVNTECTAAVSSNTLPILATKCPKCPPGHEPRSCFTHLPWSAQCESCPHQTFSKHWSRSYCRSCTQCSLGFYPAVKCTKTRDTLCFPCDSKNCALENDAAVRHNKMATGSHVGGRHFNRVNTRLRFRTETEVGPPYQETTFQGQALAQKGGRSRHPKQMTNVGIYAGIGIGIAALVMLAIIIWCCCKYKKCCSRQTDDEIDDPSKPTYVAMTPITPGEKDHLVFPTVSGSPHHVVMVSIPNGDCNENMPRGHGPIDIPCLGLLDDGDDIKFIDESSSDDEYHHVPHHDESSPTLERDCHLQSSLLTPPSSRYVQTSSPSLSTRPLLKSDCEQSTDTLDSSLIQSNDSILDRTPVDDLDPEVTFAGRRKRPRSPDPFAVEEDEPLLDRNRTQKVKEANGVSSNWWDTQSTSSSDGSEPPEHVQQQHEQQEHEHHQMIPIIMGSHHHQCPNTEHSLTELERQFDAMISDWEQFQQGNKETSCPYYIYEDQCLETIPESPEFDYQESETSRCSSISALYPWRKPPYSRHPPPPTDSESSDSDSDEREMPKFDGDYPMFGSSEFPRFGSDSQVDDGGPGLLMHSPQMEDLRSIGGIGGMLGGVLGSTSSSTSSLDHVLEITADRGHDNHAVILTSSDEDDNQRGASRVVSDSSLVLEQKLSVVRPLSFADDDRPSRPRSLVEERSQPRVDVSERPHSMVELEPGDLPKIPLRTTNNHASSSSSSSSNSSADSSSEDSSLLKEQITPVVYQNKMFQD